MSKKVWGALILFGALLGTCFAALIFPEVKAVLVEGLTAIGGTIWTSASGGWASLGGMAGASGLNFLITVLVVFGLGIASAGFMHSLWSKRPKLLGGQPIATTVNLRGGPEPELPQSIEKTVPSEVKKEET